MKNFILSNILTNTGNLKFFLFQNNNKLLIKNFPNFYNYIKNSTGNNLKEKIYLIYHNLSSIPICDVCDKQLKLLNFKSGFQKHCSKKCSANSTSRKEKIKNTCLSKYNVENPYQSPIIKEKIKQTNLSKYNIEYPQQNQEIKNKTKNTNLINYGFQSHLSSPIIRNKINNTNLSKYNTIYPTQNQIIKDKIKNNCLIKYNVTNISKLNSTKEKIKQTNLSKYNVTCSLHYPNIQKKIKEKLKLKNFYKHLNNLNIKNLDFLSTKEEYFNNEKCKFFCNNCNKYFYSKNSLNNVFCSCYKSKSSQELEIVNWLNSLNINFIQNSRKIINPLEIDFFLNDFNLALELHGLFWHNESKIPKNYHLNKYNLCKSKNIKLIQIFENEWLNKKEIVKSIILNKLNLNQHKIYARNCKIKEINSNIYKEFLDFNHIQGSINSKIKLGLFYQDELVSIIGLSQSRFKKDEIEIIRYCNKLNTTIIGGFSKLIKYINRNYNFGKLISYIDLRYFDGNGYINNGFEIIGQSQPNYFYINKSTLESRIKYQKHKLKNILINFDKNLSEHENMLNNNIYRIYDVGNLKLQYEN